MTPQEAAVDHYAVLGAAPGSTHEQLRTAYRRSARRAHPDLGGARDDFVAVQLAWHVLGDPDRRAVHDAERTALQDPWDAMSWGHDVPRPGDVPQAGEAHASGAAGPYGPYDPSEPPPRGAATRSPRTLPPRHVLAAMPPPGRAAPRTRAWMLAGLALAVALWVLDAQVGAGAAVAQALGVGMFWALVAALWATGSGGRVSAVALWLLAGLCVAGGLAVAVTETEGWLDTACGAAAWVALAAVMGTVSWRAFRAGRRRRGAYGWTREHATAVLVLAEAWNACLACHEQPGARLVRVRRAQHGVPRRAWAVLDADGALLVWAPAAAPDAWHAAFAEAWRRRAA